MEEYIKLLELPEEFDLSDLKKAYRTKVLKYHPDKASNEAERIGYEALMRKLNEANEYLKEYLERHEGKYTKGAGGNEGVEEEEYQTDTEDYSDSYGDNNETAEENSEEEVSEEYEENTPLQTEVIYKSLAVHSDDYKLVFSGKLYLYSDHLEFKSVVNSVKQYTKIIMLHEIQKIRKVYKLKHVIEIVDVEGNVDIFVLDKRDLWVNNINRFVNVPLTEVDGNKYKGISTLNFKYTIEDVFRFIATLFIGFLFIIFLICLLPEEGTTSSQQPQGQQETSQEQENTQDKPSADTYNQPSQSNSQDAIEEDVKIYMREMQRKVKSNWDLPKEAMQRKGYDNVKVTVSFNLSRDGSLIGEPEIKKSSGLKIADIRCIEAVKISAPFMEFPKSIKRDNLTIDFTFEANRK